jgi:hypothetical protein
MTYSRWFPGAPNEYKPGDDLAIYYTQRSGRLDMKGAYLNTSQDMASTI